MRPLLKLGQMLKNRGAGLAGDPRVFAVLQGAPLARALTTLLRFSGRLSKEAAAGTGRVARLFGLASARKVERLTERLERLEAERWGGQGSGAAGGPHGADS